MGKLIATGIFTVHDSYIHSISDAGPRRNPSMLASARAPRGPSIGILHGLLSGASQVLDAAWRIIQNGTMGTPGNITWMRSSGAFLMCFIYVLSMLSMFYLCFIHETWKSHPEIMVHRLKKCLALNRFFTTWRIRRILSVFMALFDSTGGWLERTCPKLGKLESHLGLFDIVGIANGYFKSLFMDW